MATNNQLDLRSKPGSECCEDVVAHRKLTIANVVVWIIAIILIVLWILCLRGKLSSAISKLDGQPTNLPQASQDHDSQTLALDGDQLTLSNGNTITLPTTPGPQGPSGGSGATGPAGATGAPGPTVLSVSNTSVGNLLDTTVNGVTGVAVPIVNSNVLGLAGSTLTSAVNGVASAGLDMSTLYSFQNGLTNIGGGVG